MPLLPVIIVSMVTRFCWTVIWALATGLLVSLSRIRTERLSIITFGSDTRPPLAVEPVSGAFSESPSLYQDSFQKSHEDSIATHAMEASATDKILVFFMKPLLFV